MTLRDKINAAATPYLDPGETIQVSFIAQRGNPAWFFLSYWILLIKGYFAIVVTDQRILVFRTSTVSMSKFKSLHAVLPREFAFGEPKGKLNYKIDIDGTTGWVHLRYWNDLRAADAARPAEE
jgi:hypothetical protein